MDRVGEGDGVVPLATSAIPLSPARVSIDHFDSRSSIDEIVEDDGTSRQRVASKATPLKPTG